MSKMKKTIRRRLKLIQNWSLHASVFWITQTCRHNTWASINKLAGSWVDIVIVVAAWLLNTWFNEKLINLIPDPTPCRQGTDTVIGEGVYYSSCLQRNKTNEAAFTFPMKPGRNLYCNAISPTLQTAATLELTRISIPTSIAIILSRSPQPMNSNDHNKSEDLLCSAC